MRSLAITLTVLSLGCALTRTARAEMVEVSLRDLSSLARITFTVPHGSCEARIGPDGKSLWLLCPSVQGDLERQTRGILRTSPINVSVHERVNGVAIEFVHDTILGGYHLEQRGRRVTLDIGQRTHHTELDRLVEELRWPLADDHGNEELVALDSLFKKNQLSAARNALENMPQKLRTEMVQLRRADIAHLEGDLEGARRSYRSVASRYRHRPCGLLGRVRQAQIEELIATGRHHPIELPLLPPLGPQPQKALAMVWLGTARLAAWRGDYTEAFRLARILSMTNTESSVVAKAKALRSLSIAAMLQEAMRASDHEKAAEIALTHSNELTKHAGADILTPLAYRALMHFELPEQAVAMLQTVVGRTDSDQLVIEWAHDMAKAYLADGQVYRASQVVDYSLAVAPRQSNVVARLKQMKALVSLAEGRPSDAFEAVEDLTDLDPALQLRLAKALLRDGSPEKARELLDRFYPQKEKGRRRRQNPRNGTSDGKRGQAKVWQERAARARAEAHLLTKTDQALALADALLADDAMVEQRSQLAYLKGQLLVSQNEWSKAEETFKTIEDESRWSRLGKIAAVEARLMSTITTPPSETEDESASEDNGKAKARRRRRRHGKGAEQTQAATPEKTTPQEKVVPQGKAAPQEKAPPQQKTASPEKAAAVERAAATRGDS